MLSTELKKTAVLPSGQPGTLWNRLVPPRPGQYVSNLPDADGGHAVHAEAQQFEYGM